MLTHELIKIFKRDLEKLSNQIQLFENEKDLWLKRKNISNSPGNLCLHIIGNLKHFVGHVLGNTDYIRDREHEFSAKNISKKALIQQIEETKVIVEQTLRKLDEDQLNTNFPIDVFKETNSVSFFLIHLSTHLSYHLGQINYFRRLL